MTTSRSATARRRETQPATRTTPATSGCSSTPAAATTTPMPARRRVPTGNRPGLAAVSPRRRPRSAAPTGPAATSTDMTGARRPPALEALLADPAVTQILHHRAPTRRWSIAGRGWRCTMTAWAIRTRVADVLLALREQRLSAAGARQSGGRRAAARRHPRSRRPSRRPRRRAWWRRSAAPSCRSALCVDLVPGGNKDVQALLDALVATRRNVIVTGDAAALPSVLAAFGREVPADRRVVAIGAAARSRSGWIDLAPDGRRGGSAARRRGPASRSPGGGRAVRSRGRRAGAGRHARPERHVAGDAGPHADRGDDPVLRAGRGRAGRDRRPPRRWWRARSTSTFTSSRPTGRAHHRDRRAARLGPELALDVALSLYNEGSKRDPRAAGCRAGACRRGSAPRWRPPAARCRPRWSASRRASRHRAWPVAGARLRETAAFFDRFRSAIARLPAGLIRAPPPAAPEDIARAEAALGRPLPDATRRSCARSTARICSTRACSIAGVGADAPRAADRARPGSPGRAGVRRGAVGRSLRASTAPGACCATTRAPTSARWRARRSNAGSTRPSRGSRSCSGPTANTRPRSSIPRGRRSFPTIALRQAERALKVDPGAADAEHARGLALARLGRREAALAAFARARPRWIADNPWPWFDLGRTALALDEPAVALPAFRRGRDRRQRGADGGTPARVGRSRGGGGRRRRFRRGAARGSARARSAARRRPARAAADAATTEMTKRAPKRSRCWTRSRPARAPSSPAGCR